MDRWVAELLAEISQSLYGEIVVVVLRQPELNARRRWRRGLRHFLYSVYQRLDSKFFAGPANPLAPIKIDKLLAKIPTLVVAPQSKGPVDRFANADLEAIGGYNLDVLLRFGFGILRGPILHAAKFGVWSYHHGDNRSYRGKPALFWEIYNREKVAGSILQVLNEKLDQGEVLYRSYSRTDLRSLAKTRYGVYWKSSRFVLRCLRRISYGKAEFSGRERVSESIGKLYKNPTNLEMIQFLPRVSSHVISSVVDRYKPKMRWGIAWARRPREEPLNDGAFAELHYLIAPEGRFYADPFLIEFQGRTYIFFEDFSYRTRRGVISAVELLANGSHTEPRVVLERPYHLSYPFLFRWRDEVYMIPETAGRRRIEAYRAVGAPFEWEFAGVLVDGVEAVDATLVEKDGRLWLFANVAEFPGITNDELFVYHSTELFGEWTPMSSNPVISDVRCARPAGAFFVSQGALIRPSQDCSRDYGWRIKLNRVTGLTTDTYTETEVGRIEWTPGKSPHCVHTINFSSQYLVVDFRAPHGLMNSKLGLQGIERLVYSRSLESTSECTATTAA